MRMPACLIGLLLVLLTSCITPEQKTMSADYDLVIRNGTIYDGSGQTPFVGDVAIKGDTIAAVGKRMDARRKAEIDARGRAVAPGFINMLS